MSYLVPGPTEIDTKLVSDGYAEFFGTPDVDCAFMDTYRRAEAALLRCLYYPEPFDESTAEHSVVIMTGEAMLGLWGGLSSLLSPGDVVLSVGTGLYGEGIGAMAKTRGATVVPVNFEWNTAFSEDDVREGGRIHNAIVHHKPKMVTAVHVEGVRVLVCARVAVVNRRKTPSGTVNPVSLLGKLCRSNDVLFYVDMVSGFLGEHISIKESCIDIALVGTQKCLSLPADLAIVGVSERAWEAMASKDGSEHKYHGYDALLPFRNCSKSLTPEFPYTMHWNAIEVLARKLEALLENNQLEQSIARHKEVAMYTWDRVEQIGLELFVEDPSHRAATVTAVLVPEYLSWPDLSRMFKEKGLSLGGNYDRLAGGVFRIGHMGSQADMERVKRGMDLLEELVKPLLQ